MDGRGDVGSRSAPSVSVLPSQISSAILMVRELAAPVFAGRCGELLSDHCSSAAAGDQSRPSRVLPKSFAVYFCMHFNACILTDSGPRRSTLGHTCNRGSPDRAVLQRFIQTSSHLPGPIARSQGAVKPATILAASVTSTHSCQMDFMHMQQRLVRTWRASRSCKYWQSCGFSRASIKNKVELTHSILQYRNPASTPTRAPLLCLSSGSREPRPALLNPSGIKPSLKGKQSPQPVRAGALVDMPRCGRGMKYGEPWQES